MVVLATFSAVPVVVAMVLADPATLTVPPPVAVNAGLAPVFSVSAPVKSMLEPVLALRKIPVPVSVTAPEKVTVPPVRF